ncbi:type II toxin-antitoxin system RelB family antitoxin [Corynebacterium striatum]|uniref:type II toxin-antitoxin system RelB family antitoxin n=2 Tax=Corynebacteriaceae TaxID=1653 RepID=UPI003B5B1C1C
MIDGTTYPETRYQLRGLPVPTTTNRHMTVRMSDEDAELVRKYVGFEGTTISEFARSAMLEKIEDHADLQELRAAIEADDGQRFSINDVLEELD